MVEALISDWLEEYSTITEDELTSFAAQHQHNHEVAAALFAVFHNCTKYPELTLQICSQLFNFFRSTYQELKLFALQFLPTLIYIYLNSVARGDIEKCYCIETFLISVYNLEIVDENGQPKTISFRMPFLAQHSIYHEAKGLAQTDLRRWEECSAKTVRWGPMPHVETLCAQNRIRVMTALLFIYNRYLCLLPKASLHHLCKATSMLMTQGFAKTHPSLNQNNAHSPMKSLPRIPLTGQFMLELIHAVYFAMYNEFASIAQSTVEDIHRRAVFELYPDVILVTNAIKHYLAGNPTGQPSDGPMGISCAISPASTTVTVSKTMITNASFRTKKLPDDIPIQSTGKDEAGDMILSNTVVDGSTSNANSAAGQKNNLIAISEEKDATEQHEGKDKDEGKGISSSRGSSLRGSKDGESKSAHSSGGKGLPKLPAFPGLSKKTKEMKHTLKNGSTSTSSSALSNQVSMSNSTSANTNSQSMSNIPESKSLFEKRTGSSKGSRISSMHIHITGNSGSGEGDSPSLSSQTLEQTSNSTSNGSLTLSNLSLGTTMKQDPKSNDSHSKLFSLAEFRKNKDLESIRIPLRDYSSREDDNGVFDSSSVESESQDGKAKPNCVGVGGKIQQISQV
ncbi:hyccin [Ctenocephalides felis]|uniref:hyccin n=1 Tax=Ctenocephalides felis TaxID=7515 RepID=UPI000E6E4DF0|nr:hyccin [Ctenocephalides felis]